jgi:hypothetical protein
MIVTLPISTDATIPLFISQVIVRVNPQRRQQDFVIRM